VYWETREAAGTERQVGLLVKNLSGEKGEKRFCRLSEKMYIGFS
jgi:hypothetical protein